MADSNLVKIAFPLNAEESDGITRERLWAKPMPDGTFVLDNSPFHVYGISYRDIVHAELEEEGLVFSGVAQRGGHSTYRLKLPSGASHGYFLEFWPQLEKLSCTYEGTSDHRRLYSIDVPPGASVQGVYDILTRLEAAGVIEFEEGHYSR